MNPSFPNSNGRRPTPAPSLTGRARRLPRTPRPAPPGRAAFTLIEILVTVALLAFIILGLFATFNQVQRAFRQSMSQVDKLEAGRAISEMLPRELEQIAPSDRNAINFYAEVIPGITPLSQALPGTSVQRRNLLEDCFLLQRQNQTWVGVGYCVRNSDSTGKLWYPETSSGSGQMGVGSLYRFYAATNVLRSDGLPSDPNQLYLAFRRACVSGSADSLVLSNRICDGVIHLHFRAFATNGCPIYSDGSTLNAWYRANPFNAIPTNRVVRSAATRANTAYPDNLAACFFSSNAVPAALEMEVGLLDQYGWDRYSSIAGAAARLNYLQSSNYLTSSRIYLFRQRIPIRNVDPVAYQ